MNDFTDIVSKVMEVRPDDGDYTGEDGLLYCGKCHTPKEAYFEDGHAALFGRDRHPTNCTCQQSASAFLRAEPLRRTITSPPESIMRTN